jgi:hypothetical protein
MDPGLEKEIECLRKSKVKELQNRYRELFGEDSPSSNREHLYRRIAWRLQARETGELIRVSPRTVHKYLVNFHGRTPDPSQRWLTFVHNHAHAIVACDFFVVFTARFRILYVLVIMELGRRQILHHNVTAHPSAEWTL